MIHLKNSRDRRVHRNPKHRHYPRKNKQTTKMQRLLIAASAVAVAGFMAPPARPASVRMDASVDSILEDIKGLTLVEASELVSKIEETFGVDASSAPVAMAVAGGAAAGGGDEAADEKDEFDVVLTEVPADKKIAVLKIVRTITGLGLKARDRRLFFYFGVCSPFYVYAGGQGHGRERPGDDQGGRAQGRGRGHPEADRGGRRQGRAQVELFPFPRLTYVPLLAVACAVASMASIVAPMNKSRELRRINSNRGGSR